MTGPIHPTQYEGFLELGQLCRLFGISPSSIRRRLQEQGLPLYKNPSDRRLRMIAKGDVKRLFHLVPVAPRARDGGMSEG